jgi:uncharacterized OB-fold protein
MMTSPEPLPLRTLDAQPYWDGCLRGELLIQRCTRCGAHQFYPRAMCVTCTGPVEFVPVSGRGVVHSLTVCHRPLTTRFGTEPYVVALVDLAEGPRMMTNIVGCPPESVHIGMNVAVSFQRLTDDVAIPVFEPVTA